MNSLEESDQVTYSFLFIITPLEIISTKTIKNLKKSLLLKLGNKTQKTSQLNKPIQMPVDVLYSKILKKYCPIKGIIKVYDINLDGSQVISSVGGFQTQEILNQQKTNVIIQRDVGTSKIKMKIQVKNLGAIKGKPQNRQKQTIIKKQEQKFPLSRSRTRQNAPEIQPKPLQKSRLLTQNTQKQQNIDDQNKSEKSYQYFKRTPTNSTVSSVQTIPASIDLKKKASDTIKNETRQITEPINKIVTPVYSSRTTPSIASKPSNADNRYKQQSNSELGKQLTEQRNNSVQLENKLANYVQQINSLKNIIEEQDKDKNALLFHFEKLTQGIQTKNGKIWMQNNQKDKLLSIKYKQKGFDKVFNSFFEFVIFQLSKPRNALNWSDGLQQNIVTNNINSNNNNGQIKMLNDELSKKTNEIFSLRAKQRQKGGIQIRLKSKQRQCLQLENRIKQMQILKKTLKQQNNYLKQKDQTMQQIISQKQNQIQLLKQQITQIQLEYKQMQSTVKNDGCEIQQLRQQVSNLNEIIDGYRQKYGDLKNIKNRTLQNELKQCLIWIDQQTRQLEMSDFAQDTQPSHSHNVSQIIKGIQLQGASRQQMNSIKVELAGLIKRIDNFLAK